MKSKIKLLLVAFTFVLFVPIISQAQYIPPNEQDPLIEYDSNGKALFDKFNVIVRFDRSVVNDTVIDDTDKDSGLVSEFINASVLDLLIDSGYFTDELLDLKIYKVHRSLTTGITYSVTRLGDTITIPPTFVSTFMIEWDTAQGYTLDGLIDTLLTFWPIVRHAQKNYYYHEHDIPNDSILAVGRQAGLVPSTATPNGHSNLDDAWDVSIGADNTIVAIVDSGIDWDHEDFSRDGSGGASQSRVVGGTDFQGKNKKLDIFTVTDFDHRTALGGTGHGTQCAGIIGAIRDNTTGISGIAGGNLGDSLLGVRLLAQRAIQSDGKVDSKTAEEAIVQSVTGNSNFGDGAHVVNLSFGGAKQGSRTDKQLMNAMEFAYNNHVSVAASSGNNGISEEVVPASFRDHWCLKTGAARFDRERASFSSFGYYMDFIAPGDSSVITSMDRTGGYETFRGTSASAPFAAGVSALMISYINNTSNNAPNSLAPEDIEALLEDHAIDVNTTGWDDQTGNGFIDAGATLQGIVLPRYKVEHFSHTRSNSDAVLDASNLLVAISNGGNAVAAGNYYVDRYKITRTYSISLPSSRNVVRVWPRNSSSDISGIEGTTVSAYPKIIVSSFNQTSVTLVGYIYHVRKTQLGKNMNKWVPSSNAAQGTMAYTVYSDDSTASSVEALSVNRQLVRCIPNPADNSFKLSFTLFEPSDYVVELRDINGKLIQTIKVENQSIGHQEQSFNTSNLNPGIYICALRTKDASVSKKVIITH